MMSRSLTVPVAVLPIVAIHACLLISAAGGFVPWCFPYVDGETSISATGRHGVGYWLFKAMMLPQAYLLVLFWRKAQTVFQSKTTARRVRRLGSVAATFLVLYLIFLGSEGPVYRLMRRYGVFVYFVGTFIAQWITTRQLPKETGSAWPIPRTIQRTCLFGMLLLALAEAPLCTFGLEDNVAENIIEWNFALLMQIWFATWSYRPEGG